MILERLHQVINNPISSAQHNTHSAQLSTTHQMISQSCDRHAYSQPAHPTKAEKSQAEHQCSSANLSKLHHKIKGHLKAAIVTELITEHAFGRRRHNHLRRKQWI
jgi:hypothetical protein